jgi:hypothetical protein
MRKLNAVLLTEMMDSEKLKRVKESNLKSVGSKTLCQIWKHFRKDEEIQGDVLQALETKLVSDDGIMDVFKAASCDVIRTTMFFVYVDIGRNHLKNAITNGLVDCFENKKVYLALILAYFPELLLENKK